MEGYQKDQFGVAPGQGQRPGNPVAWLGAANQKAFELMTTAFTDAMARSFKPVT